MTAPACAACRADQCTDWDCPCWCHAENPHDELQRQRLADAVEEVGPMVGKLMAAIHRQTTEGTFASTEQRAALVEGVIQAIEDLRAAGFHDYEENEINQSRRANPVKIGAKRQALFAAATPHNEMSGNEILDHLQRIGVVDCVNSQLSQESRYRTTMKARLIFGPPPQGHKLQP